MSFRSFIVLSVATILLVSCAAKRVEPSKPVTPKKPQQVVDDEIGSAELLDQARLSMDVFQRNTLLLQAAQALQTEHQCTKSIKLLHVLKPEIQDNRQLTLANLLVGECYLLLPEKRFAQVEQLLSKLSFDYGYQSRIAALNAEVFIHKGEWLKAAAALQKTTLDDEDKALNIWAWIKKLNQAELEDAVSKQPSLQPWLQLALITKGYGLAPEAFERELSLWQNRHAGHALVTFLPSDTQLLRSQPLLTSQKTAILLPLSGRLANQGIAIKEGILAAYLSNLSTVGSANNTLESMPEIRFIDSALRTAQELLPLLSEFDVIIGPLLKDKISALHEILPPEKRLLALNRVDLPIQATDSLTTRELNSELSQEPLTELSSELNSALNPESNTTPQHAYFSLAPEDEAEQLAAYIKQKQFAKPIIFAADNPTTQRMAQAFLQQWRTNPNAIEPDLTIFKDNKDMRIRVAQMLDVKQSKQRIRQIERLADVEVIGVERNRRDIDAIVLFANPEQTELLNPIIEASLSPFAKKSLSVFASSRSYSLDLNSNNLRDLRNLTFTDMPWMLPTHNWQALADQTKQLWPQKQDTLLRLFALGFDAYTLLPYLARLQVSDILTHQGLTGTLSIDQSGVIHRTLPWAKITQNQVQIIAMD